MSITVLPRQPGLGNTLAEVLEEDVSPMLQQQLSDYYQQQKNRRYALGVGQQLGVPDPEKFAENYRYIPPNQLSDILMKQAQTFAVLQDLLPSGENIGLSIFGASPKKEVQLPMQKQDQEIQNLVEAQQPPEKQDQEIQNLDEAQQPPEKKGYTQLEGVEDLDFNANNLAKILSPRKFTPPIGEYGKEKRKYQEERAKEDRAELAKFADSFAPLEDLRSQAKSLDRLEQVLAKYDPNKIQNAFVSALDTGFTDSLRKIFTTEDQDIIESLVIPFVRTKDFGGSNPSTKEVLLKMKQYPSIYNSKAANKVLLGLMKSYVMSNLKKAQAAQILRRLNPDADPRIVKDELDKVIERYQENYLKNDKTKYKIRQYDKKTNSFRQGTVIGIENLENALGDKNFETEVL